MDMTWEAGIILAVSVSIVITNVLTLLVLYRTDLLATTNRYFFASLTIADLLLGLLYTPFSFWAALVNTWVYGDRFCHIQAYLAAVLWIGD